MFKQGDHANNSEINIQGNSELNSNHKPEKEKDSNIDINIEGEKSESLDSIYVGDRKFEVHSTDISTAVICNNDNTEGGTLGEDV